MRLCIPEEEQIKHFADPAKKYCAFDELEKEFSHLVTVHFAHTPASSFAIAPASPSSPKIKTRPGRRQEGRMRNR